MTPSPGTTHVASSANSPRSAKPCWRANASKMRRTTSAFSAAGTASLPPLDEAFDVPPLGVRELEPHEQPSRLVGVVVRNRRLEVLPERGRLAELAPEPAEKAHACLVGDDD